MLSQPLIAVRYSHLFSEPVGSIVSGISGFWRGRRGLTSGPHWNNRVVQSTIQTFCLNPRQNILWDQSSYTVTHNRRWPTQTHHQMKPLPSMADQTTPPSARRASVSDKAPQSAEHHQTSLSAAALRPRRRHLAGRQPIRRRGQEQGQTTRPYVSTAFPSARVPTHKPGGDRDHRCRSSSRS
jgi:hypothetical protein